MFHPDLVVLAPATDERAGCVNVTPPQLANRACPVAGFVSQDKRHLKERIHAPVFASDRGGRIATGAVCAAHPREVFYVFLTTPQRARPRA